MKFKLPFTKKIAPFRHQLEFLFKEGKHSYYKFQDDKQLPVIRMIEIDALMELRSMGISGAELDKIVESMEGAITKGIQNPKSWSEISFLIHCIKERRSMILHRDIMLNMAAMLIVRDDEDVTIVDKVIHNEKLEVFEKKAEGGEAAYDFFTSAALKRLLLLESISKDEFNQLWAHNQQEIRKLKRAFELLEA